MELVHDRQPKHAAWQMGQRSGPNTPSNLFRKEAALHALVLVVGQHELQTGLTQEARSHEKLGNSLIQITPGMLRMTKSTNESTAELPRGIRPTETAPWQHGSKPPISKPSLFHCLGQRILEYLKAMI